MRRFEIKKDPTKWQIMGTGAGIELAPKRSSAIHLGLNDLIRVEEYGIELDLICIMDVLDEKPRIVSGHDNLGAIIQRINKLKVPLIAPYRYEEIPLSMPFPIEECKKKFGQPYFSNTIGYMIAFALLKGAKEIHMFGVNQASQSEFGIEKAATEYWLGVANGMGVKIIISGDKSELLRSKLRWGADVLYGYNKSYEGVIREKEKYGERLVKKLLKPLDNYARIVRQIN